MFEVGFDHLSRYFGWRRDEAGSLAHGQGGR